MQWCAHILLLCVCGWSNSGPLWCHVLPVTSQLFPWVYPYSAGFMGSCLPDSCFWGEVTPGALGGDYSPPCGYCHHSHLPSGLVPRHSLLLLQYCSFTMSDLWRCVQRSTRLLCVTEKWGSEDKTDYLSQSPISMAQLWDVVGYCDYCAYNLYNWINCWTRLWASLQQIDRCESRSILMVSKNICTWSTYM